MIGRSIRLRVGYDLQAAVFTSSDDDLTIVAGLETAYFVLIFDDLHFSLQFQEGQLPDEQFFLAVHKDLNIVVNTRHSVESVLLMILIL